MSQIDVDVIALGRVVDEGRGSLPFALVHGEALVTCATWALSELRRSHASKCVLPSPGLPVITCSAVAPSERARPIIESSLLRASPWISV